MVGSDQPIHKAAKESAAKLEALLDREPSLRDALGWFNRHPIHVTAHLLAVKPEEPFAPRFDIDAPSAPV